MTVAGHTRFAALAKRLIEKHGRTITLRKESREPAVAGQEWRGPDPAAADTSNTPLAAFVPPRGAGLGEILSPQNQRLLKNTVQVALLASTSVPGVDVSGFDSIVDNGRIRKFTFVEHLQPGQVSILWVVGMAT